MNPLQEIARLLLNTGVDLYIFVLWLRFLLQAMGADFYNPLSQFAVAATRHVVDPIDKLFQPRISRDGGVINMRRRVQRWSYGALIMIMLIKLVQVTAVSILMSGVHPGPLLTAYIALLNFPGMMNVFSMSGLLPLLLNFYFYAIIAGVILSWIAPHNPSAHVIAQITEPVLGPCRRILPSMGGLDLSPIIAILGLNIAEILLRWSSFQIAHVLGL